MIDPAEPTRERRYREVELIGGPGHGVTVLIPVHERVVQFPSRAPLVDPDVSASTKVSDQRVEYTLTGEVRYGIGPTGQLAPPEGIALARPTDSESRVEGERRAVRLASAERRARQALVERIVYGEHPGGPVPRGIRSLGR